MEQVPTKKNLLKKTLGLETVLWDTAYTLESAGSP